MHPGRTGNSPEPGDRAEGKKREMCQRSDCETGETNRVNRVRCSDGEWEESSGWSTAQTHTVAGSKAPGGSLCAKI